MSVKSGKNSVRKKIIIESFIVFFIAISPFLFKLYDYLPESPEATINILGIEVDNGGFHSVSVYFWFLMSKIIPLSLLILWFFTSKNWWYHILIIPIAMYAFQLFEVLFDSDDNIDTENIWWLLPICMLVVPFVYLIRIKLYDRYVHGIDLEAMEAELNALKARRSKVEVQSTYELPEPSADTIEYRTLSEWLNQKLSTGNLQHIFQQFQHNLKNWMHLKF